MNLHEIEIRQEAARRAGRWAEVKQLSDLRRTVLAAQRQNSIQRAGVKPGSFHQNSRGFNASADARR